MLFVPQTDEQVRQLEAVIQALDSAEISAAEAASRLQAIEPDTRLTYLLRGTDCLDAGDYSAAESIGWEGLQRHPTDRALYLRLADARLERHRKDSVSRLLIALATWKLALLRDIPDEIVDEFQEKVGDPTENYRDPHTFESIARDFDRRFKPDYEKPAVRDLLLPYRLLNDLQRQAPATVESRLVRDIAANAGRCAPILHAALKDWARHRDALSPWAVRIASALLGEIAPGDTAMPGLLSDLLELSQFRDSATSLHAHWAIWRIGQRFPSLALAAFRAAAPQAKLALRCRLADHIRMLSGAVKREAALSDLLKGFSALTGPDEDDAGAPYLLAAIADALGPDSRARQLLARYPDWTQAEGGFVPSPMHRLIPGVDIQAVCLQRALAGRREEDADPPPAAKPAARPKPARNEPCWCGSGVKYKKCHLAADENAQQPHASNGGDEVGDTLHVRLFRTLLNSGRGKRTRAQFLEATRLYFDQYPTDVDPKCGLIESFYEWFVFDFRPGDTGPTAVEDYLRIRGPRLPARERAMLESWRDSRFGFWEVRRVEEGTGFEVKDVFAGDLVFVDEPSLDYPLAPGDYLVGRIEEFEGLSKFGPHALHLSGPLFLAMAEMIEEDSRAMGQEPAAYVRANTHRWYRLVRETAARLPADEPECPEAASVP